MADTHLSVVATSRNDGHGGHLVERMQWFIDGLAYQADQNLVDVELVMVEWNPPPSARPLAEVLRGTPSSSRLRVRIVTVPGEAHDRFASADRIPLFQMIAKNVGIRRAYGRFILATNIDILFSTALFRYMRDSLQTGHLYRADRHDVDFPFDRQMSVPEALMVCEENTLRLMRKNGAHYPGYGRVMPVYQGLADVAAFKVGRLIRDALSRGPERLPKASGNWKITPTPSGVGTFLTQKAESVYTVQRVPRLHTNACGDFTLLARDDWSTLRGYPEWPMFSWNLDSVLLYQAAAAGIPEVDLDSTMPLFHMEHDRGSGWTPEGRGDLFTRLDRQGVRYLTDRGLRREALALMRRAKSRESVTVNLPTWGLVDETLPEVILRPRPAPTGDSLKRTPIVTDGLGSP